MVLKQKEVSHTADGRIRYIVESSDYYASETGNYTGYSIAAVDSERGEIVARIADVTCDRALAAAMADLFNRHQLAPVHLKDAILDMLP